MIFRTLGYIFNILHGVKGSIATIATFYGLDVPGIESRWGEIFRTCPDRPWGPPSSLYNGYWVFSGSKKRPRLDSDRSLPSRAVGHERVELYLFSPYGPYGLYRVSVPAQGCTLPYFTFIVTPVTMVSMLLIFPLFFWSPCLLSLQRLQFFCCDVPYIMFTGCNCFIKLSECSLCGLFGTCNALFALR
jgi:hypothetical protein